MLILLTGLPGTGKSTVAQMIAQTAGGTSINSDVIRRELFPNTRTYSREETKCVIEETQNRVRKLLYEKETVILDALFTKQNARDEYRILAEDLGEEFKIILVTAPEVIVKDRLQVRTYTNDPSEATYATYLERKKYFEPVLGEHLVIENGSSLEALATQIKNLLFA